MDPEAGTAYHVFQLLHDTFYDFRLVFQQLRGKLFIHPSLRDKAKTALFTMEQNNPVSQHIPLKSQRPQQRKQPVGNTGNALKTSYV